ncbi:acyltransferase domain-containing protein [Embleya sp. AB8]|uniref:acyltransferase domain-containing protein n=1 Tax=Embleya sp. AB8 TaxID=3156304 RepID=UPI003C72F39F
MTDPGSGPPEHPADLLRADERLATWLTALADFRTGVEITLPAGDDLVAILLELTFPHEDINDLVATRGSLLADPFWHELFECAVRALLAGLGTVEQPLNTPALPAAAGPVGHWFHVFVYLAARPHVLAYHHTLGIPADVSRRTLADLGRHVAVHRRRHGTGGLLAVHWPKFAFRGELYQLGRLQFQRSYLLEPGAASAAARGLPYRADDPVLMVHIPDFHGPLTPAACDESLSLARDFFPRHFPTEDYRIAVCGSWLLDPQLREYLPNDTNIIRFQRRFHLDATTTSLPPADTAPIGFVFGNPDLPPEALPRHTTLQRAIGDHLRAGHHWHVHTGWFEL